MIPTIPKRKELFEKLWVELLKQKAPYDEEVELISWDAERPTIGAKRNALLGWAKGKFVAFIDDDDRVSANYIDLIMEGIKKDVDCCSLKGVITTDGKMPEVFEHSLRYKEWRTVPAVELKDVKHERNPNHLNCIRASIAKQFKFPETNYGEDHDWSKRVHQSGLLITEHYIDQVIYYYDYVSIK